MLDLKVKDTPKKTSHSFLWWKVNTGKFFLGLLIFLIGLSYLAEISGLVSINVGYIFQHFWSILLIFLGLSLLSRRSKLVSLFGFTVAFSVLIALFYLATDNSNFLDLKHLEKIEVEQSLEANVANISIDSQAAALKVDGGGEKILTGTFQSPYLKLKTSSDVKDGKQVILLTTRDQSGQFNWEYFGKSIGNFSLKLGNKLPIDLEINSAAADINLNLVDIAAQNVTVKSAASNIIISLGQSQKLVNISVRSRASAVTLLIPKTVGVSLNLSSNISTKNLPNLMMTSDGEYETKDFSLAKRQAVINIDSSVTSLDIVWQ